MENIFLDVFNMSLKAGFLIIAVLLLRLLLRKAPKYIHCMLWVMVFVRLLCPVSLESSFSLVPDVEGWISGVQDTDNNITANTPDIINKSVDVSESVTEDDTAYISDKEAIRKEPAEGIYEKAVEGSLADSIKSEKTSSSLTDLLISYGSWLWLPVTAALFIYALASYIRLRKKVAVSIRMHDNIWYCDDIDTPFILGMIKPKIYLPSGITEEQTKYVTEHERAHLRRFDHWLKPIAYMLVAIYWFNPLVWLSYILFSRDIELACDEHVVCNMNLDKKKAYSDALLSLSGNHFVSAASPLAFGETGVKKRIKNVLDYKKPTLWILVFAVIVCIGVGVCFLTSPIQANITPELDNKVSESILKENNYLINKGTFGCEAHDVLAVTKSGSQVTVYTMALHEEFGQSDGKIESLSGGHYPVAITFDEDNNKYTQTEYWVPADGSDYESSIKDKFPRSAWSNAMDTQKYYESQHAVCIKKAEEYFSEYNKKQPNDDSSNANKDILEDESNSLKDAKTKLASYANDSDELAKQGCFVCINDKIKDGIESWNNFIESVNAKKPAELVIAQFTKEGDAILDYLKYDTKGFYHVLDTSRDEFAADGNDYYEENYQYIKLYDNVTRNGDKSRQLVLTSDINMSYEEFVKIYNSDNPEEYKEKCRSLLYVSDGIGMNYPSDDTSKTVASDMLLDENDITKVVITNGYIGDKKTFAVTDGMHTYLDIMEIYNKLELEPSEEEVRIGYGYRMEMYDYKDNLIQTVKPYKDVINIDDKMYTGTQVSTDLMLYLSELW